MGQCNFCTYSNIKQRLTKTEQLIKRNNGGGITIYIIPRGTTIPKKIVSDDAFSKKYFTAWFMELPTHCVC
jgi:hypothetical protein